MLDAYQTFLEINANFGPSGYEEEVRKAIAKVAEPYADEITTDALGNLIVHKKGPGKKIMCAAHMDSIGIIATHFEESGHVRFGAVGGINAYRVIGTPVKSAAGVVGTIQVNGDADLKNLKLSDLFIDLGVKDRKEAMKLVQPGDMFIYDTPTYKTSGGEIVSPYNDDRCCCVAQLMALSMIEKSENDLYFVFTVQEEVGLRGAKPAAYAIDPDYGIACDVTTANNIPHAANYGNTETGKGAAIKIMDSAVICHSEVVSKLEKLAKKHKIPYQRDIITAGGTDAGPIHMSRSGVKTGGISVPCKYTHSPQEMVSIQDIESVAKLMAAFCE